MKTLKMNQMEVLEGGALICLDLPDVVPVDVCRPFVCAPGMVCIL